MGSALYDSMQQAITFEETETMTITTKGNWAVHTQPRHRLDGNWFPAMVIVYKRIEGTTSYKPVRMI